MKRTNRIVALLLAAAIVLGFYVPSTAQAATPMESFTWGFTEANRKTDWSKSDYWTVNGTGLQTNFDLNQNSGVGLAQNEAYTWGEYTVDASMTTYKISDDTVYYTSVGMSFCEIGGAFLRLQVITKDSGATANLYYSTTGKSLSTKTLSNPKANDDGSYTYGLHVTISGGKVTASVTYTQAASISNLWQETEKTVTVVSDLDLSSYSDLKAGGLGFIAFRPFVPGNYEETTAEDGLYLGKADLNSVTASMYSYTVINDTEVTDPVTFADSFTDDTIGQSPDYWVEDSGANYFKVAASPSSVAAEGCTAPSGNTYKYSGTDYARTWLHVFETNVDYSVKIFVPTGTSTGKVGLLTRMTGLEVPAVVKIGYDYDTGNWFTESGKGAVADYGDPIVREQAGTMEAGMWHTVRVVLVDRYINVYCDDMDTPVMTVPTSQITGGRVGLFADGIGDAYFDDVNLTLLSGESRVESAVLDNYVLNPKYTGITEGGSIIRYDENTLLLNVYSQLFKSLDNGSTFTRVYDTDADYAKYEFFVQNLTQYIRLHNGYLLKLVNVNSNLQTWLSKDNGASYEVVNTKMYNLRLDGLITSEGNGYYGGMNDMVKEINLGDIDGDGQDNYRVFYCGDVRTTGVEGNIGNNITYHWQEVYYTDDYGYTWHKADYDTRWYSGLDHVCESRIMPVYNEDGSLKCVRMFCTWNDGRSVRYFDSFDYGQTWTSEKALPELSGGRNSYAYAYDEETGYIYLAYLYGEPTNDENIYPRNRFVLLRSKDATNWEFLMDLWRWEDVPADALTHINQTVDPSMTIDGDRIFVTAGWSEWYLQGSPHNNLRQTLVVLDKNKLTAYDAFPNADECVKADDIVYVEVTAPDKRVYLQGEDLDLTGGYLTVHYYNGSTKQVALTDATVTVTRPDADWLWTSEFDTSVYPHTGKAGMQWIRAEYIEPNKGFNDGFADGFYIYVAADESDMGYTLFDSTAGMTSSNWETSTGSWSVADNKLTASFDATGTQNASNTLVAENTAKWSGYTASADFSVFEQSSGSYTNLGLRIGLTDSDRYELRVSALSDTACTVSLYSASGIVGSAMTVNFASALTANADGSLPVSLKAQFVDGKLVATVNGVTADKNGTALSWDVDRLGGGIGLFVYRNGTAGTAKVILNSLKIIAPSVRNYYDANLLDKIGLNIHMGLSDAIVQDTGVFMKFILNGVERMVSISDATVSGADYAFTTHVAAKEMADTITAQMHTMSGVVAQHTTSVKDYASYIVNTDGYEQRDKDIAAALLNYGAAAQLHFNHNTENLANGGFADGWNSGINVQSLAKYAPKATGTLPEGVEFYGTSLIMENRTTIRHYYKMDAATAANLQATLYGETLALRQGNRHKDGTYFYYVDVTGVDAANLDYAYTVTLTDGANSFSVTYSALSYVYQVLNTASYEGTTMQQLAQALYLFHRAVEVDVIPGDDEFEILPF